MKLIRGIHNLRAYHRGCVLTIGNFDGVHLGHQAVLRQVVSKAKELDLISCVMLFEPQPREFFSLINNEKALLARISSFREKYVQLAKLGIEQILLVNFNSHFSQLSAEDFIHSLLVDKLNVNFLIIGDDFRFGAKQQGDFTYLIQYAPFDVINTKSFQIEIGKQIRVGSTAIRVSSTAIREALALGNLSSATAMLGRHFSITGRVIHGQKLGRTLDFPTANIALKRYFTPLKGVFAVRVGGIGEKLLKGVANVGMRPTVKGTEPRLEVHIFNFKQDLYGKQLEVHFFHKLRDERKFTSLCALKQQIAYDALAADNWLKNN